MKNIFEQVLMIGPDGKKGGIASVINTYMNSYTGISFLSSYPEKSNKSKLIHFLQCAWQLQKTFIKNNKIKIIHLHVASKGSFLRKSILLLLIKLNGRNAVFHMHGGAFREFYGKSNIRGFFVKKILKWSDVVIALSEEWQGFYKDMLKLKNVWTIGNPVDMNVELQYDLKEYPIKMLFLGRVCNDKGIFDLIDVLTTNEAYLNNKLRLDVAGFGEVERLKNIIQTMDTQNNIQFIGWIEGIEKKEVICRSDIFILPSYYEGLPVSIIECMMSGKPIISTIVGGVPTLVKEGYNGWLFIPGDKKALDRILNEVVDQKNKLHIYGKRSYIRAAEFSPEKIEIKLKNLYDHIGSENSK